MNQTRVMWFILLPYFYFVYKFEFMVVDWDDSDLARYSSLVKDRWFWGLTSELQWGVYVYGEESIMSFKKLLPEWCQRQSPSCQEHECHFWGPFVWELRDSWRHWCSPHQLFIVHRVPQVLRSYPISQTTIVCWRMWRRRIAWETEGCGKSRERRESIEGRVIRILGN